MAEDFEISKSWDGPVNPDWTATGFMVKIGVHHVRDEVLVEVEAETGYFELKINGSEAGALGQALIEAAQSLTARRLN